jgi:hypothetical protein
MLVALVLWFILVKIFKNNFYSIVIILCIIFGNDKIKLHLEP